MENIILEQIDDIRRRGFRPQVVGCFVNNGNVLFLYNKEYDLWMFPQGGIKNGEDLKRAINREMSEELGDNYIKLEIVDMKLIGEDSIVFPARQQNTRQLKTDSGEEIFMQGKHYFFIVINTKDMEMDINKTEFDEYVWVNYEKSQEICDSIYQKGKQRMTKEILDLLGKDNLI